MAEILIVDDHSAIRRKFSQLLESEGYAVRTAVNGDKALEAIYVRKPDLVLMDIDMPHRNGYSACEEIRKFDRLLPIIFLTGFDTPTNELRARGLGADDFFAKDADEALVLAAVRRSLARAQAIAEAVRSPDASAIVLGAVTVDMNTFEVSVNGRRDGRLTKTEADLLRILAADRGCGISSERLIARLRGEGFVCEDAMLYVHMSNLRRKLGPSADYIVSVRGEGYHLKR